MGVVAREDGGESREGKKKGRKTGLTQSTGGRQEKKGTWMGRMGRMKTGRRTGGGVGAWISLVFLWCSGPLRELFFWFAAGVGRERAKGKGHIARKGEMPR
jgi:hypothetical protein